MASMESGVSPVISKGPEPQIIELSDNDETDDALTPAERDGQRVEATGPSQESSDDEGNEDSLEDFSDSDSFIQDLINSDDRYEGERCTPEEAADFRRQLHELGIHEFVRRTIDAEAVTAKKLITAFGGTPPSFFEGSPDTRYYRMLGMLISEEVVKRQKLPQYNSIDDAAELIRQSSKILVITGAGISTNLGIPDFRSEGSGFYSRMREKGFDDPEIIFDLEQFREDPRFG